MVLRVDLFEDGVVGHRYVCEHENYKSLCRGCEGKADELRAKALGPPVIPAAHAIFEPAKIREEGD